MVNFIEPDSTRNILSIEGASSELLHWIESHIESEKIADEIIMSQLERELENLFSVAEMGTTIPDNIGKLLILINQDRVSGLDTIKLCRERGQFDWDQFIKFREFRYYPKALCAIKLSFQNVTTIKEKLGERFLDALKLGDLEDRIWFYQTFRFSDEVVAEIEGIIYCDGFRPEFLILNEFQPDILEPLLRFSREEMEPGDFWKIPRYEPGNELKTHWIFLPYINTRNEAVLDQIYADTDLVSIMKDMNLFFEEAYADPGKWLNSYWYSKRENRFPLGSIILPDNMNRAINGGEKETFAAFHGFLEKRIATADIAEIIDFVALFLLPCTIKGSCEFHLDRQFYTKILKNKKLIDTLVNRMLEPAIIENILDVLRKSIEKMSSPATGANDFATDIFTNIIIKLSGMYDIHSFLSTLPIIRFSEVLFNRMAGNYDSFLVLFRKELKELRSIFRHVLTYDSLTEEDAVRLFTLDGIDPDAPVDFMKQWQAFLVEQLFLLNDVKSGSENIYNSNAYKLLNGLYDWIFMPYICDMLRSGKSFTAIEWKRIEAILTATVEKGFSQKPALPIDESTIIIASVLVISGSNMMSLLLDSNNINSDWNGDKSIIFLKILKEMRKNPDHDWDSLVEILKRTGLLWEIPSDIIIELPIDHADYIDIRFEHYLEKPEGKILSQILSHFISDYSNSFHEKGSFFMRPDGKTLTERGKAFFIRQIGKRLSEEKRYDNFSNFHIGIALAHRWKINDSEARNEQPDLFTQATGCARNLLNAIRASVRFGEGLDFPEASYDCVWPATELIAAGRSYWKGLMQLLLIFRHLREPSLSKDLRPDGRMAEITIPDTFEYILKKIHDEDLYRQCRLDMAHDLADFLKPIKRENLNPERSVDEGSFIEPGFDPTIKEPDPLWRYAYVRAIGDLGVDPSQKGHYYHGILIKVAQMDPSDKVRNAAKKVVEELTEYHNGWKPGSHKRLLFNAWWWIKQAHMFSTGGVIDPEEALKTRNTEFR